MIPFLSPALKVSCEVPVVEVLVGHKYIALGTTGSPGLGSVTLLQDHNCVPHMAVRKMNPEV